MKRTNLSTLILIFLLAACSAPKYGLHFQNTAKQYPQQQTKVIPKKAFELVPYESDNSQQVLSASAEESVEPILNKPQIVSKAQAKKEIRAQRRQFKEFLKDQKNSRDKQLQSDVESEKKLEPHGVIGFFVGFVGLLFGFSTLFVPAIILIVLGAIFGWMSLSFMKKEKGKWKGRGYAIAALGMLGVSLLFIALIPLMRSFGELVR